MQYLGAYYQTILQSDLHRPTRAPVWSCKIYRMTFVYIIWIVLTTENIFFLRYCFKYTKKKYIFGSLNSFKKFFREAYRDWNLLDEDSPGVFFFKYIYIIDAKQFLIILLFKKENMYNICDTRSHNIACHFLEKQLGYDILHLHCRHHVFESFTRWC